MTMKMIDEFYFGTADEIDLMNYMLGDQIKDN
jgi:hypothetical protein